MVSIETLGVPSEPQSRGWPRILAGEDVLIAAPTGSGKTLSAFLAALDRLLRLALENRLEDRTSVVYVSPLKALGNDVQKNLLAPLEAIYDLATGGPLPRADPCPGADRRYARPASGPRWSAARRTC